MLNWIELIICIEMGSVLNDPETLICHKIQPNNIDTSVNEKFC